MRTFDNDYNSLRGQMRAKASSWRHSPPSAPDFLRTLDSWQHELERLDQISGDARVKAALEGIKKLTLADRRSAVKSVSDIALGLDTRLEVDTWEGVSVRATKSALGFDTPIKTIKKS